MSVKFLNEFINLFIYFLTKEKLKIRDIKRIFFLLFYSLFSIETVLSMIGDKYHPIWSVAQKVRTCNCHAWIILGTCSFKELHTINFSYIRFSFNICTIKWGWLKSYKRTRPSRENRTRQCLELLRYSYH